MYLLRLLLVLRLGPASANYGLWAQSSSFIHALSVVAFLPVYQGRGVVTETVWPFTGKVCQSLDSIRVLAWSIRPSMIWPSPPTSPLSLCTSDPLALGTSVILSNFQKLTRPQQWGCMITHWHGPQSIPTPCASGE